MISYISGHMLFPLLEALSKRKISAKVDELNNFSKLTNEDQKKRQKKLLFEFLTYCEKEIPFYQELFRNYNFEPKMVLVDIKLLQRLPVLTKEIIRENSNNLKGKNAKHQRKTGGSTGQSAFFYYDDSGLDWTSAMHIFAVEMAGKYPHRSDCHISADLELIGLSPTKFKDIFLDRLRLRSQNRSRLMLSAFDDNKLECAVHELKRMNPYMLQGHPSSAYALAEYIHRHHAHKKKKYCQVFEPSGEMMTQKMVDMIEKNLGCKVFNRYGNAEFGVLAHSRASDPWTKLLVFRRAFYVEEAENSELIVTNFTNTGFPLIRYQTGDIGTVVEEEDGCFIYNITGRVHDCVVINEKKWPTHFLMDVIDHKVRGVRHFQVHINTNQSPLIKIVLEAESENERSRVLQSLRDIWPVDLSVEFVELKDLERVGWQQKFRHIIDKREK